MTDLNRRHLLAGAAASTVAAVLPSRLLAQSRIDISAFIWTGAQETAPRAVFEAYQKANPNVHIEVLPGTNLATYPKVEAAFKLDPSRPYVNFGYFNASTTSRGRKAGLLASLSSSDVPNLAHLDPAYQQPDGLGAFFATDVDGILYNTEKVDVAPKGWADLVDPRFKGRVALIEPSWSTLIQLARINGGSEENIEPGFAALEAAARAGQFHSFASSNAQLQQLLVSGEVWITAFGRSTAESWRKGGAPIGFVFPQEGYVANPLGIQLVKGGTPDQVRVSLELVNALLAPETVLDYARYTHTLPLLKDPALLAEFAGEEALRQQHAGNAVLVNHEIVGEKAAEWTEQWRRRISANLG